MMKLETFIAELLADYLKVASKEIQTATDAMAPVDVLVAALESLFTGYERMEQLLPNLGLREQALDASVVAVRHLCRHHGRHLRTQFRGKQSGTVIS